MVDRSKIGQVLSTLHYEVERNKIRELADAIGDANPIYHDVEAAKAAGYRDLPAPPTFPTLFSFWGRGDTFKLLEVFNVPPPQVLHGEEEYTYFAPVYAGDTVNGTLKLVNVDVKEGKSGKLELVTFELDYNNQHGEKVLQVRQVAVIRHPA